MLTTVSVMTVIRDLTRQLKRKEVNKQVTMAKIYHKTDDWPAWLIVPSLCSILVQC